MLCYELDGVEGHVQLFTLAWTVSIQQSVWPEIRNKYGPNGNILKTQNMWFQSVQKQYICSKVQI